VGCLRLSDSCYACLSRPSAELDSLKPVADELRRGLDGAYQVAQRDQLRAYRWSEHYYDSTPDRATVPQAVNSVHAVIVRMVACTKRTFLKKISDGIDTDSKLAPELPVPVIRGMCRGINTDVPNDAEPDVMGAPSPAQRRSPVTTAVARNQRDSVSGVHGSTGSPRTGKG
jgi:hypothetical protein